MLTSWTSAGSDRFGISSVPVANGTTFPEALAGTPLAVSGVPIFLLTQNVLSASVFAEVRRLSPERVVAPGGPAGVSHAVLALVSGCA